MKLSNVITAATTSVSIWLFIAFLAIVFNALLGNGFLGVFATYVLFTAWISGIGVLINLGKK